MDSTAHRKLITDYASYAFYKSKNKVKSRLVDNKKFNIIVREIFKVASENIIDREGGIVLNGLGYISHWVTPIKRVFKLPRKGGYKLIVNYHSDSYYYNTTLFTNVFIQNKLRGWSMDKSFNRNIKKGIFEEMKKGKKYKFYYSLVARIFKNIK